MKFYHKIIVFFILFCSINSFAQSGCTDPLATNYNPNATTNDGSCVYAFTHIIPAFRDSFATGISESSGLVFTDGKLWTHNDSGNPPYIFSVDTTTGAILQTVIIDNYPNTDWEDITADSNYIYIGDFGNNNGSRTDLKILKIAKSDITNAATIHVNAQAISFSYTDQTSFTPSQVNNFDCESVISIKDSLYIFTKDRGDGATRVYKLPKTPGTYAVSPYTNFYTAGLITGADYNPVTKEILLIGYLLNANDPFIWKLYDYQGDLFFSGNKRRIEISNGSPWQTEGICWLANNRFFVSCESTNPPPASFYVGNGDFPLTNEIINNEYPQAIRIYPNPSKDILNIDCLLDNQNYRITDMNGKLIAKGKLVKGNNEINISKISATNYGLIICDSKGAITTTMYFLKQ